MKNYRLISFSLSLIATSAVAQNPNLDYKGAIKVSNMTTFEEQTKSRRPSSTASHRLQSTTETLQLFHPTVAYQWKSNRNNLHEIELSTFMWNKVATSTLMIADTGAVAKLVSGGELSTTDISIRYEYIWCFNKSKESKLVPSVGFGFSPFFRQSSFSPKLSSSFSESEVSTGLRTYVTPRLCYFLSPKLFIDLNVPLSFNELSIQVDKTGNPAVEPQQRTISNFNYQLFPRVLSVRLGLGLKL